jgi:sugar phosphate isomerase/epimerase
MRTSHLSRRQFLRSASAATAGTAFAFRGMPAHATPLGLPLGLQLYSVREQLAKDYDGTLKQLASLGYREVEAAGFYDRTPDQVRSSLRAAGLRMPSAHYSATVLQQTFDDTLAFGKALGLEYIVCSFPAIKDPSRLKGKNFRSQVEAFTLEDYRWNAENFNVWGKKVKAAGMQFGYHNHTMEFTSLGGTTGFDEMVRLTDPSLVTFEMDCGWVSVGGGDPAKLLRKYPTRISMLHIKDFKPTDHPASVVNPPAAAELGRGTVQFRPIFEAAAKSGHIRHMFVEQEGFDVPPMEALGIDARFMQTQVSKSK